MGVDRVGGVAEGGPVRPALRCLAVTPGHDELEHGIGALLGHGLIISEPPSSGVGHPPHSAPVP
jgi:hypothetical protein